MSRIILVFVALFFLVLVAMSFYITGYGESDDSIRRRGRLEAQAMEEREITNFLKEMQYLRDGSDGPCFVSWGTGSVRGAPGLTYVPCDKVPAHRPIRVIIPK